MYTDIGIVENAHEDFIKALALLHSSELDSAEKLWKMLNAKIEQKLGIPGLLDDRVQSSKSQNIQGNTKISGSLNIDDSSRNTSLISNNEKRLESRNNCAKEGDYNDEDSMDNIDVPRISIPDEISDDNTIVCKICSGDKYGPLILLECQECQDAYHPLCHQPAVIEIDVYDPRLVWRCGKCVELSSSQNSTTSALEKGAEKDEDGKSDESFDLPKSLNDIPLRMASRRLRNDSETSRIRCSRRTRTKLENIETSRRISRSSTKSLFDSGVKLKKRVGSKISVSRLPK